MYKTKKGVNKLFDNRRVVKKGNLSIIMSGNTTSARKR